MAGIFVFKDARHLALKCNHSNHKNQINHSSDNCLCNQKNCNLFVTFFVLHKPANIAALKVLL